MIDGLTLELGHGKSGVPEKSKKVATDLDLNSLAQSPEDLRAIVDATKTFPYADNTFTNIVCRLPMKDLLLVLGQPEHQIWSEIHRVLKPGGMFDILADTSPTGRHGYKNGQGQEIEIEDAPDLIRTALKANCGPARPKLFSNFKSYQVPRDWVAVRYPTPSVAAVLKDSRARFFRMTATKSRGLVHEVEP